MDPRGSRARRCFTRYPVSCRALVPMYLRARVPVPSSLCPPGVPASRCFRTGLAPCLFFPRKQKLDNMKPKHPDEQEIPFRLRELMRSREAMKRPDPGKQKTAGGIEPD